jgi:hypothetical protein
MFIVLFLVFLPFALTPLPPNPRPAKPEPFNSTTDEHRLNLKTEIPTGGRQERNSDWQDINR